MKKHVYQFGNGKSDGDGKMKDILGGKGAGLAEMSRALASGALGAEIGPFTFAPHRRLSVTNTRYVRFRIPK